jgi:hypothetical protein
MRLLLLLTIILLIGCKIELFAESTPLDSRIVHRSDLNFFFDSVSYEHGKWHFELSRNSMGMLWRTIDGKDDLTGVCSYKQTIVVPKSSSLEIKTRDISILFRPDNPEGFGGQADFRYQAGYRVWKRIGQDKHTVGDNVYASYVMADMDGRIEVNTGDGQ